MGETKDALQAEIGNCSVQIQVFLNRRTDLEEQKKERDGGVAEVVGGPSSADSVSGFPPLTSSLRSLPCASPQEMTSGLSYAAVAAAGIAPAIRERLAAGDGGREVLGRGVSGKKKRKKMGKKRKGRKEEAAKEKVPSFPHLTKPGKQAGEVKQPIKDAPR